MYRLACSMHCYDVRQVIDEDYLEQRMLKRMGLELHRQTVRKLCKSWFLFRATRCHSDETLLSRLSTIPMCLYILEFSAPSARLAMLFNNSHAIKLQMGAFLCAREVVSFGTISVAYCSS